MGTLEKEEILKGLKDLVGNNVLYSNSIDPHLLSYYHFHIYGVNISTGCGNCLNDALTALRSWISKQEKNTTMSKPKLTTYKAIEPITGMDYVADFGAVTVEKLNDDTIEMLKKADPKYFARHFEKVEVQKSEPGIKDTKAIVSGKKKSEIKESDSETAVV